MYAFSFHLQVASLVAEYGTAGAATAGSTGWSRGRVRPSGPDVPPNQRAELLRANGFARISSRPREASSTSRLSMFQPVARTTGMRGSSRLIVWRTHQPFRSGILRSVMMRSTRFPGACIRAASCTASSGLVKALTCVPAARIIVVDDESSIADCMAKSAMLDSSSTTMMRAAGTLAAPVSDALPSSGEGRTSPGNVIVNVEPCPGQRYMPGSYRRGEWIMP